MNAVSSFLESITLEQLEADPYPTYKELRSRAPVAYVPAAGALLLTRYDDCKMVSLGREGFVGAKEHPTLKRVFGTPNVLTADGSDHKELRAGINPRLRPKTVEAIVQDAVRPIARFYGSKLSGVTHAELMGQFFEPISVDALRHVMGLDEIVSSATLRKWFYDLNVGTSNFGLDPEMFAVSDAATAEIEKVLTPKLEYLVAHPDDSLLSHMLWSGRDSETGHRAFDFIFPSIKVILLGGMQEPGHAAGSTLLGLLSNYNQWERLKKDPATNIPLAIEEGMRWIAPIGVTERQATQDVVVGGQPIAAGTIVQVVLGSANRDEARFEKPEAFDFERPRTSNQAFGNGIHFCAGHNFARAVEQIMFEELIRSVPNVRLDPDRKPDVTGWVFRAPKSLPVIF